MFLYYIIKRNMSLINPEYDIVVKMPQIKHYFYKIASQISGKCYIGQTCNISRRICEHLTGEGSRSLLIDITLHRVAKFDFEVLRCIYDEYDLEVLEDY